MPVNTAYLGGSSDGTTDFTSDVSANRFVVGQGTPLVLVSSFTQSVVAITVSAQSSALTTFTNNDAAVNDIVVVGAPSAVSGDLTYQARVSAASTIELRLSNVSGTDNAQTAQTWRFGLLRF